ncbi:uroporphyrinogen-III synthase [Bordetella genomosp. 8]|uniref:uroporphyrinogen-III synthase n=1 Tax=Bordetella genomosp. 8 TaxID=1416806 RepID=UPI000A3286F9|nr:uroporphyrinogen-III synthase [Bordetella genomosp. 8]
MQASETRIAILTRPPGRNENLAARLEAAGWEVRTWPALDIEPLPSGAAGIPLPRDFDLAVFVSGNAAAQYLDQLRALGLGAWPPSCVIGAVGPATAARLRDSGSLDGSCEIVHPTVDAPRHDSEALWDLLAARGPIPRRVLLVRGTAGRDWLAEQLRGQGADVHAHAVYRRVPVRWDADALAQLRRWTVAGCHPSWLLTSGASVEAVRANVDRGASPAWWQECRFVLTHPRLVELLGLPPARATTSVRLCAPADDAIFDAFVSG